jgi:RNA ligase
MKDSILLNNIWKEVEKGNVSASTSGPLTIFKYTQQCIVEDNWNDVTRLCRGIIFHSDGTIVARPFAKFFNLGEKPETQYDQLPWTLGYEVIEKMDGSCGIGYFTEVVKDVPGSLYPIGLPIPMWRLATPGSMESDQAIEGTRLLNEWAKDGPAMVMSTDGGITETRVPLDGPRYNLETLPKDCTPIFEIIYPDNRIVVNYSGESFLSLLAIFDHNGVEWHPRRVDQIAESCGFKRPKVYDHTDLNNLPFADNSEGYVIRFESGFRLKIKNPWYVRIHRLLNYLSPKKVIELIRGKEYRAVLEQLPQEIAKDFDDIRSAVQQQHDSLYREACVGLEGSVGLATRKEQAQWIQANVEKKIQGLVFGLLDEKDIEEGIWKIVLEDIRNEKEILSI